MKKLLLSVAILATSFGFAQTLQSDNFNTLTLGNVGTDITGATAGQAGWFTASSNGAVPTTSTNTNNTNYQIIAGGNNSTYGLQITSPNGDKGSRFMWKDGLGTAWAARTSGNNIIEVEYDFFTGPITDLRSQIGMRLYGNEIVGGVPTSRTLNGFVYTTNTRVLSGVAYLKNGATNGTFLITLATGGLILNANTWYRIGFAYNTTTGETIWKTSSTDPGSGLPAANWIPNLVPDEADFVQVIVGASPGNPAANPPVPAVPANTATGTMIFDNYTAKAVATSNLLSAQNFTAENNQIAVYPNPAKDVLNIKSSGATNINAINVVDLNGRQVISKSFNNVSDAQINVNELSAGMYLINISSENGTTTQKFLKQ